MLETANDIAKITTRLSVRSLRSPRRYFGWLAILAVIGFWHLRSGAAERIPHYVSQIKTDAVAGGRLVRLDAAFRPLWRADGTLILVLDDTACRLPESSDVGGATLRVITRADSTRLLLAPDPYWTAQPAADGVLLTPHYPGVGPGPIVSLSSVRRQGRDWILEGSPRTYAWRRVGNNVVVDLIGCVPTNSIDSDPSVQLQLLTQSPYPVTRLTCPVDGPFALSAGPPWTVRLENVPPFPADGYESGVPIVVLDPGHGGADSGTIAASGLEEKTVTLKVARTLQAALEARGCRVLMTRTTDQELRPEAKDAEELGARVALAAAPQVAAFVSLHCDASDCLSAAGPTLHWNKPIDRPLADALASDLRLPDECIEQSPFYVLRHTSVPSVLVELGYLSNPVDADRLSQSSYDNRLANVMADSLTRWLREVNR